VLVIPNLQPLPFRAVQLYEDARLSVLSDQIYSVPNPTTGQFDLVFRSDPDLITLDPTAFVTITNLAETGGVQDVSRFFEFGPNFVQVQSDVEVPEPTTLALAALGALPLLVARRLRSRRSRLVPARV
jgi:hypothetical protein